MIDYEKILNAQTALELAAKEFKKLSPDEVELMFQHAYTTDNESIDNMIQNMIESLLPENLP